MQAIAYDADGVVWGVAHGRNRYDVRRALFELGALQPGFTSVWASGPRARVGDVYAVGRSRRQWYRGERRQLTPAERATFKRFARSPS